MNIDISSLILTCSLFFAGLLLLFIFKFKVEVSYSSFDGSQSRVSILRIVLFFLWLGFIAFAFLESSSVLNLVPSNRVSLTTSIIISSATIVCVLLVSNRENKKNRP